MAKAKNTIPQAAYADEFVYNGEKLDPVQFVEKLESAFAEQEHWKGAYFWGGDNGNRNRRNWQDRKDSHVDTFEYDGHTYKYVVDISRTRHNTYVRANTFTIDGGGNVRAWKKVRDQVVEAHPALFLDQSEEKTASESNLGKLDVSDVNRSYMIGNVTLDDGTPAILMLDVSGHKDPEKDQLIVTGEYSLVSAVPADGEEIDDPDCELYHCFCTDPVSHATLGDNPLSGTLDGDTYEFRREYAHGPVEDHIDHIDYLGDAEAGVDALGAADELVSSQHSFDGSLFKAESKHSNRASCPVLSGVLDRLDAGFIRVSDQNRSLDYDEYWQIENAKTAAIESNLEAQQQLESRIER